MAKKVTWELPIRTVSEMNVQQHWTVKSKRHRQQQFFVRRLFALESTEMPLPCVITLTRLSTHSLDEDNLCAAFKWVRDEISECLLEREAKTYQNKNGKTVSLKGRSDANPSISWVYKQEKAKRMGVRIEIEPRLT